MRCKGKYFDQFSGEIALTWCLGWKYYMHLRSGRDQFWAGLLTFPSLLKSLTLAGPALTNIQVFYVWCVSSGPEPESVVHFSYRQVKNTTPYFKTSTRNNHPVCPQVIREDDALPGI